MKISTAAWLLAAFFSGLFSQCAQPGAASAGRESAPAAIEVGAQQMDAYLPLLKNKRVGIVANQSTLIRNARGEYVHLVDTLLARGVDLARVYSPEHGFRGKADAGEKVADYTDPKTGLRVLSLYGRHRKPTPEYLKGIEVMLFDLQDVGARFYTYISTMHYVMEACAESNIPLIVLDRPNPNGDYVDGPVLDLKHQSFVGMHAVPIVHGMTVGEFAQMINGEGWLNESLQCDLQVVPCLHYDHSSIYEPPVKPSPNLPNLTAIRLYPSLCLLEGTVVSVGRGTDKPFQIYGHPDLPETKFSFTPQSNEGAANPKHKGKTCHGQSLWEVKVEKIDELDLSFLIEAYEAFPKKEVFFNNYFTKLAGGKQLQQQLIAGLSERKIKKTWKADLEKFRAIRERYLLYEDF